MDGELKKAVHKARIGTQSAFAKERATFKALVIKNPNYFGNLAESPFQPVLPIAGNTQADRAVPECSAKRRHNRRRYKRRPREHAIPRRAD